MTATLGITRRFVAGSGIALSLLGPVTASYGTCDERAERRADRYARRADHAVRVCVKHAAFDGRACPDRRTDARLARLRASVVRVHAWRCPGDALAARLDALTDRILCHRLARCEDRLGTMRVAVTESAGGRRLDVDSGWSGIAHGLAILEGAGFVSELTGCGAAGDARCELFGRTAGTPFGAPSPISAGGIPVCVTVDFATDVVGHVDLGSGDLVESATVAIGVYVNGAADQPCPACITAGASELGGVGVCRGGANDGGACVVGGLAGAEWGEARATSQDCPPAGAPLAGIRSVASATTGVVERGATLPCENGAVTGCWCPGQERSNGCVDGQCTATGVGGVCALGPLDARCEAASHVFCASDADCPPGDRCGAAAPRSCFPDPIRLEGTPASPVDGHAHPTLVGVFCMGRSGSRAVDAAAGYPGPTAFVWPAAVTFAE